MSEPTPPSKYRTSALEARAQLLEAVISLAETVPLPDLTARRIAHEVSMDPNVIFRNFETLENLYIAVLRELEQRTVAFLKTAEPIGLFPTKEVFPWIKFSAWLSLSGVDPALIASDPALIDSLKELTMRHMNISPTASSRAQSAAVVIAFTFLQAQVLFTPTQPGLFTQQALDDSLVVLSSVMQHLDQLTTDRRWEQTTLEAHFSSKDK